MYEVQVFHPQKLKWVTISTDIPYTDACLEVRGCFDMGFIARVV